MKIKNYSTLFVSAALLLGCNQDNREEKQKQQNEENSPNILWINTEDIGPALGCYGDEQAKTPFLDQLAGEGIVYTNAYASSPICAPSRSTLITGIHSTSMGTQHLRSEVPMPESLKILPEIMSAHGYYCITTHKTDYNFSPRGRWDEINDSVFWKVKETGKPFFSMVTIGSTHEGRTNSHKDFFNEDDFRHDPSDFELPPYVPQTAEMRAIYARQYDLITKMDKGFGEIIDNLKKDGLYDNTIIFFFSDHGFGLPKGKRWLLPTGLKVPLIVRIPQKYQGMANSDPGTKNNRLVNFPDFAPTVLNLAGLDIPEYMQGTPFLGEKEFETKKMLYGSRSRADDVYDISRSVFDGKYFYVKHFLPYLPIIEDAMIFSSRKRSVTELRKEAKQGNEQAKQFFLPKPAEELYDIQADPHQMNNLASNADFKRIIEAMRDSLKRKILSTRDAGLLNEAEMLRRAEGSSPYEYAQSRDYEIEKILQTAWKVGIADVSFDELKDPDSGVRYWALENFIAQHDSLDITPSQFEFLLDDESPVVQIKAAELMCYLGDNQKPTKVMAGHLDAGNEYLALQAAISLRRIGDRAKPVIPEIRKAIEMYSGDVWGRYRNWFAPMFIGMALDQVMINCGVVDEETIVKQTL
jgi:N-sulfoglucosamine sulfohydrolase